MAKTKEKRVWKEMYGDFRSVPAEHIGRKDDRDKPNAKLEDPENDRGKLESLKVVDSHCLGSGKKFLKIDKDLKALIMGGQKQSQGWIALVREARIASLAGFVVGTVSEHLGGPAEIQFNILVTLYRAPKHA